MATTLTRALKITYPIIQAPCAGHTGSDLVAAVSEVGGLGSLGAGMIPADELRTLIRSIRAKTSKPFAVNLFCRTTKAPTEAELNKHYAPTDDVLNKIRQELSLPQPEKFQLRSPPFDAQINVLLEEHVPVVSFTFGLLPDTILQRFWSNGTFLIGTATTVNEAKVLAGLCPTDPTRKADAIVLQGLEAGGHRGSFSPVMRDVADEDQKQLPTEKLVKAVRSICDRFPIPIIAAGGLSTGEDVYLALNDWKADAVALGTLFMLAKESSTPTAHRKFLLNSANVAEQTKITRAITGRYVRAYPNLLMKRIEDVIFEQSNGDDSVIPHYDIHSSKTKDIATYATKCNLTDYMLLLAGQNASAAAEFSDNGTLNAKQILDKLVTDAHQRVKG
ncbi:2-nitropropane dioxygenase [Mycotypha africana]|uniref:2-nitropropane dioxygenase n=1 Tax=Mycotypha africana TaxID=64632 RepID=UPI002300719F|nr:2-nitropropane dioxygenase [Mycotypha africana]KAI8967431.1 2-nitropropane dioxygenase [Mycotypha africana]